MQDDETNILPQRLSLKFGNAQFLTALHQTALPDVKKSSEYVHRDGKFYRMILRETLRNSTTVFMPSNMLYRIKLGLKVNQISGYFNFIFILTLENFGFGQTGHISRAHWTCGVLLFIVMHSYLCFIQ